MEAATLTLGTQDCHACTRSWASTGDDEHCPFCDADLTAEPEQPPAVERHEAFTEARPGGPALPPADHAMDGNPEITTWCPTCSCTVLKHRDGCMWCGSPTMEP